MIDKETLDFWASLAEEGELIPESVKLLGRDPLTEAECEYAKTIEERARKWHQAS